MLWIICVMGHWLIDGNDQKKNPFSVINWYFLLRIFFYEKNPYVGRFVFLFVCLFFFLCTNFLTSIAHWKMITWTWNLAWWKKMMVRSAERSLGVISLITRSQWPIKVEYLRGLYLVTHHAHEKTRNLCYALGWYVCAVKILCS